MLNVLPRQNVLYSESLKHEKLSFLSACLHWSEIECQGLIYIFI